MFHPVLSSSKTPSSSWQAIVPTDTTVRSRHTPFQTVKVVILGQDPYHNVNQAHGLAFSVRPPTNAPPSLRNMYVCLKNDYPSFVQPPRNGGLLTPWAERGVLMLNTCLTVRAHEANSHANRGWERFTQKVIDLVAARRSRGVVFMAWGTPAGKRVVKVDKKRHLVLSAVHPSPLSAHRGFFNCGHFKMANEWLVQRYGAGEEIDWSLVTGAKLKELGHAKLEAKVEVGEKGGAVELEEKKKVEVQATKVNGKVKEDDEEDLMTEDDEEAMKVMMEMEATANGDNEKGGDEIKDDDETEDEATAETE
jgi:uracil-DNA glycosylase